MSPFLFLHFKRSYFPLLLALYDHVEPALLDDEDPVVFLDPVGTKHVAPSVLSTS